MSKKRTSLIYNSQVLPVEMLRSPRAEQIEFLDCLLHVSDPDPDGFVDSFHIEQGVEDCDYQ